MHRGSIMVAWAADSDWYEGVKKSIALYIVAMRMQYDIVLAEHCRYAVQPYEYGWLPC